MYGEALAVFFLELLFFLEVSLKLVSFFIHVENGRRRAGLLSAWRLADVEVECCCLAEKSVENS